MPNITFPAKFEYLDEIRDLVAQVAREGGFTEKEIYSLQLAADEAASNICLLYTSPSPRDRTRSRMPSSA